MKKVIAIILALAMIFCLAACGKKEAPAAADNGAKKYKIALSNSYLENGWRQEMIACCELMAKTDPYYENVQLDVYNTDNTVEAQVASLESLMEMGYDALVIDCCSDSGLNNVIDKAIAKGIKCITFDSNATTDVPTVAINYDACGGFNGAFIAEAMGGKGNIALDKGIWATSNGQAMYYGPYNAITKNFPDIKIVAEYEGEWNDGLNQDRVSTILATQHLDACYGQSHAASILKACETAGVDPIPTSGDVYNMNMLGLYNAKVPGGCIPTYVGMSIVALDLAIDMLNGKEIEKNTLITPDVILVNAEMVGLDKVEKWAKEYGATYVLAENGKDFSADWPEQFMWPILPADYPRQLDPQALIDYMASVF